MKKIALPIIFVFLITNLCFAQDNSSTNNCSLIDNSRDSLLIEFERLEEKQNDEGKKEKNIILRLRNNSTCPIIIKSSDDDYFLSPLPSKPTYKDLLNRTFRTQLTDGEFIPELEFYTRYEFTDELVITSDNSDDTLVVLTLEGGKSVLFAVPFENFKKKLPVIVSFNFDWETKRGKSYYGGGTHHLVWFSYGKLPEEIWKEIQK